MNRYVNSLRYLNSCNLNIVKNAKTISVLLITLISGIKALDKVSESVNAKENLRLINERLDHMLMLVNVKKNYLVNISKISDFSYAWIYIHDYSQEMQRLLRQDSKNVLLLRATFLKLASILNFPLVRLFEIESEDIESVTNY